jgi:ribose transport system ATP-binding protein/rhamnose transport system ATP-binding protein
VTQEPILVASGIAKSFGSTRALRDGDLILNAGEVHALMGENGAGKSTFVKILVGALAPDAGEIRLHGRPLRPNGVAAAVAAGLVPIYQHLTLMPHLSVRENLLAFDIAAGSGLRRAPGRRGDPRVREILAAVGLALDPETAVESLSIGEQQLVEIARGLARDCQVLILDEPTATLNRREVDQLFAALRRICAQGRAVLFISHRLDEIHEIADRITVFRDGVATIRGAARGTLTVADIVTAMIGRAVTADVLDLPSPGPVLLRLRDASVNGAFSGVSFDLHRHEVLGLVGLVGSGALELGQALAGAREFSGGSLELLGRPLDLQNRRAAMRAGVGLVPTDREVEGMFSTLSVADNALASAFPQFSRLGWVRTAAGRVLLQPWIEKLALSPPDPERNIGTLSGGNQQKVLVIRALIANGTQLLVALEPTRGVDVGAREVIHQALADAARAGLGVIVLSSDLEELLMLCHRVIVIRDGCVVAEVPRGTGPGRILRELTGAAA